MRQVINLNSKWAFTKNTDSIPVTLPDKWDFVNLPHSWNAIDGQDGDADYYRGVCYYAKKLLKSDLPKADQYYLEFYGTNSSADVYVNGRQAGHHDGGYSTWRVNITDTLENENLIVVAVDNRANQTVYPQNADFTFYGGIYRDVNLIAVSSSHFDLDYFGGPGIAVTPVVQGEHAKVTVETYLTNAKDDQKLVYRLKTACGCTIAETTVAASETKVTLPIEKVHLWHGRRDPYLYTAEVSLLSGDEVIDAVRTRFGCRTFQIDPQDGFILNGESYPLRGVSRHQDRWGYGNALLPEHHKEDMEFIQERGAPTIRLAH